MAVIKGKQTPVKDAHLGARKTIKHRDIFH